MFWKNFQFSGSDKTPVPEVAKLRFFLMVAVILHLLVEVINNSTNAKEQKKSDKSMPIKKSVKVSFITFGTQINLKR